MRLMDVAQRRRFSGQVVLRIGTGHQAECGPHTVTGKLRTQHPEIQVELVVPLVVVKEIGTNPGRWT